MGRKAETHVRVSDDTWKRLNGRKTPGDSFDDVIQDLLSETGEGDEEGNPNLMTAMA